MPASLHERPDVVLGEPHEPDYLALLLRQRVEQALSACALDASHLRELAHHALHCHPVLPHPVAERVLDAHARDQGHERAEVNGLPPVDGFGLVGHGLYWGQRRIREGVSHVPGSNG